MSYDHFYQAEIELDFNESNYIVLQIKVLTCKSFNFKSTFDQIAEGSKF